MMQPAFADNATEIRDHNNRGNMLLGRRLFQDAISEYETVLQIDPSHAVAKGNLALAHNEWGIWFYRYKKYKEAKEQWEIAIKINPNDANVKRNLTLPNLNTPPPPTAAANPKPTGPQDWNPYDEDLSKPQVKKPFTSTASNSTSNAATTSAPNATVVSGAAISATGATRSNSANSETGSSSASSPSGLPSTSTTQVGGITSGATIIGGSGITIQPGTAGSAKLTSDSESPFDSSSAPPVTGNSGGGGLGAPDVATPDTSNSVRIIGGSSDSASIIIGGASSPPAASSYGSTISSGSGTANVFPSPGAPRTPVNTVPGGSAPIRFSPRAAGGTVPMSWPGGGESAPQSPSGRSNRAGNQSSKAAPSFLAKPEDNQPSGDQEGNEDSNSNSTVDDVLAKIENKVYGKVTKNMPILKRIERLEVETMGKKKSGSIAERLKELKETYGF